MKCKTALFLFLAAIMSAATTAIAASQAAAPQGGDSTVLAVSIIFAGLAQLGAAGYLVKKYAAKTDANAEALPQITATLKAIETAVERLATSVGELYASRNEHSENLVEINTLHDILGCKERLKELAAELRLSKGGKRAS